MIPTSERVGFFGYICYAGFKKCWREGLGRVLAPNTYLVISNCPILLLCGRKEDVE